MSRRRESAAAIRAVFPRPASGPPARIRETYMVICALSPLPVSVAITSFQFGAIAGKGRRSASEYSSSCIDRRVGEVLISAEEDERTGGQLRDRTT
jgi:hypothetical protein